MKNRIEPSKAAWIPIGLSLVCFLYYMAFLLQYGEMFYKGSDVVANTAYGMTMFSEVHRAGWTVPKLAHMLCSDPCTGSPAISGSCIWPSSWLRPSPCGQGAV